MDYLKQLKIRFIVKRSLSIEKEITDQVRSIYSDVPGIFEVRIATHQGDILKLAKEARYRGYESVFACGFDRDINEAATPLVNSKTTLGIIPTNNISGLGRTLKLPTDLAKCLSLPLTGRVKDIDVGSVNDKYFFSTAGFCVDADLAQYYASKGMFKQEKNLLPFTFKSINMMRTFKPKGITLKWDDKFMRIYPFMLTVSNIKSYGESGVISPRALGDDGELDLIFVSELGFMKSLKFARYLNRGDIYEFTGLNRIRASRMEIIKQSEGYCHTDGIPFKTDDRVAIETLPKALKVWVA